MRPRTPSRAARRLPKIAGSASRSARPERNEADMIGLRGLGSVVVFVGAALAAGEAAADEATMVVSADQPGPQYPEIGRSLFDELFATPSGYDVPFPFERKIGRAHV